MSEDTLRCLDCGCEGSLAAALLGLLLCPGHWVDYGGPIGTRAERKRYVFGELYAVPRVVPTERQLTLPLEEAKELTRDVMAKFKPLFLLAGGGRRHADFGY